jgi:hypothetical protein
MKRYERAVLKRAVKLIGAHVEPTALIGGRVFVLARRHLYYRYQPAGRRWPTQKEGGTVLTGGYRVKVAGRCEGGTSSNPP